MMKMIIIIMYYNIHKIQHEVENYINKRFITSRIE
jgi:hypothetical protein